MSLVRYVLIKNLSEKRQLLSLLFLFLSVSIYAQPGVVTQPSDTSICVSSSAVFSIVAVNTSAYQWQENDGVGWYNLTDDFTYVDGQFTPNLSINDANIGLNNYSYRCIVSDLSDDKDTSNAAFLKVYEPPIITLDPANTTVCKNEIALFSVDAINGTNYKWQEFSGIGWVNLNDNSFYTGTNTPDLSIFTTTGMNGFHYRCIVKNVSCPDTSSSAELEVNPTPIIYSIMGGGEYCSGGTGVNISLDDSEVGISYNLVKDGIETGNVKEGTGSSISFGIITESGNYTAFAYNQFTGCTVEMASIVNVVENPLPTIYSLQGGGNICEGEDGENIFMLSSETGTEYALYLNGNYTGQTIIGTGFTISFGIHNEEGFYTVIATNPITSCSAQMEGNAQIVVEEIPIANAGEDKIIIEGTSVQLTGSASGGSGNYTYNWSPSQKCITPTAISTQTINLNNTAIFTFQVIDNQSTCSSSTDTAIVYVNSGPLGVQTYSDINNICLGGEIQLMALPSGGSGNYTYLWSSSPAGFTSTLQNPVVIPGESTVYFVELSDGLETISDSISINIKQPPEIYTLQGGGNFCTNTNGPEITLSNSETETKYYLYHEENQVKEVFGTGQNLSFGKFEIPGNYTAVAVDNNDGCNSMQNGGVSVIAKELPIVDAGQNDYILSGDNANFTSSVSGGLAPYTYNWTPSDSLLNPAVYNPSTVNLHSTNVFKLRVKDANNCVSNEDNVIAFVSGGSLDIEIESSTIPVCSGNEVQLFALVSGGSGSFTYFWQSEGFVSSIFNPVINPEVSAWYKVTANNGIQSISDSIFVTVNPKPQKFSLSGGGAYCEGTNDPEIILNGSQLNTSYTLFRNGNNTFTSLDGNGQSLSFGSQQTEGEYSIIALHNYNSCSNEMNNTISVSHYSSPIVDAGLDKTIDAGTSTQLGGMVTNGSGSYNFQWQPAEMLQSPLNQNTLTNNIYQNTSFKLTVTDVNTSCQSNTDSVRVFTSGNDLYITATSVTGNVCKGNSVQLSANAGGGSGDYSYKWTSSPQGIYSNVSNINVEPSVNTSYFIRVYDGNNYAYDTIFISVNEVPLVYNINGGGSYCQGGEGLNIGLNNSQSGVFYELFKENNSTSVSSISGSGSNINFGKFTEETNYHITATNEYGCKKQMSGSVQIVKNLPPQAVVGEDETINYNTSTTLNGDASGGSGDYNYSWWPADSLLNPNSQNTTTHNLKKTTLFKLEVADNQTGCTGNSKDEVVVFVNGGPLSLEIAANKQSVCPGEEFQLFALASGGSGNYIYSWSSQPDGFFSDRYDPSTTQNTDKVYTVEVNDGQQTISKQIHINLNPNPTKFVLAGAGEYCENEDVDNIVLQSSQIGVNYELFKNNVYAEKTLSGTGSVLNFRSNNTNGIYKVVATNVYTQCSSEMNNTVEIKINSDPEITVSPDQTIYFNEITQLNAAANSGSGNYSYLWSPSHLCQSPLSSSTLTTELGFTTEFIVKATDLQTQCVSKSGKTTVFISGGDLYASAGTSSGKICQSESITLKAVASGGTGNYSYSWTSSPSYFNSNQQEAIVSPNVNTIFYLDVFDGVQHAYDTLSIEVSATPQIYNVLGGGEFCEGDPGKEIKLNSSGNNVQYSLYKNESELIKTVTGNGGQISFGNQITNGNYKVIAKNTNSCTQQMAGIVSISKNELPVAQAGPEKYISFEGQTNLEGDALGGSGYYNYMWQPADSLNTSEIRNPLTLPLHSTNIFILNVSDSQTNCVGNKSDNEIVFVSGGALKLDLLSNKSAVCPGEELQLFGLASGGSGNYTFTWTSIPEGFSSSVYDPVLSQNQTTTYILNLTDGNELITKSIKISTNNLPIAYQLSGGGSVCPGETPNEIVLSSSEVNTIYNLLLDEIPTTISKQGSGYEVNFGVNTDEGNYTVIAENSITTCKNEMANGVNVIIHEIPVANAGPDKLIFAGSTELLQATATNGSGSYNYSWSPVSKVQNPENQNTQTKVLNNSAMFLLNVVDNQTFCEALEDTTFVYVKGGDLSVNAQSSEVYVCEGETIKLLAIGSGGTGNFNYQWTSDPAGFYSSNYNPSTTPEQNTLYILEVFDGISYAYDSIEIIVNTKPQVFDVFGGGEFCSGMNGVEAGLLNSELGTEYSLFNSSENEINTINGNGQSINFGYLQEAGNYFVTASKNQNCITKMNGEIEVIENSVPIADAGQDLYVSYGNQITLNGNTGSGSGNYNFFWNPADSLVNPNSQNPLTIEMKSTTLFNLSVEDANTTCVSSEEDEMVVFVSGGPFYTNTTVSDNLVCAGEEIQLISLATGGSGNFTYQWVSVPAGFSSSVYNPTDIPPVTRKYYVSISDGNSVITDSVVVNVNAAPTTFNLSGGGEFCSNEDGLELILNNSESDVEYKLFNSSGYTGTSVIGTNSELSFGYQSESGEYYVEGQNILSLCSSEMNNSVTIIENQIPHAFAGPDITIASGENAELSGNGNGGSGEYLYNWAPDYLLVNPNQQNPTTVALNTSTAFLLNVSDIQNSCISNTDSTIVYVTGGSLSVNIIASSSEVCVGSSISLLALASGGDGQYDYLWTSSPEGFYSDIANPTINPESDKWYFVELNDGDQSINDSIFISVNSKPQLFELQGGGEFCQGDIGMSIQLNSSQSQTVYQLYRNNNLLISEKIGTGSGINFGEFKISGTYTSKAYNIESGCSIKMVGSAVVIQHPLIFANAGSDKIINPGENANLNGIATGGSGFYSYNWTPTEKLINPSDPSPTTINLNQSQLFELTATDQLTNCQSEKRGAIVFVGGDLPLTIEISSQTENVCPGEENTLIAIPTGGSGHYTYFWTSNPAGYVSSSNEIVINNAADTWYIVQVSDGISIKKDSIKLNTLPVPQAYSMSGGGGYCPDEQGVNIYLDNSETGTNYSLYYNVQPTGTILTGTGSQLNFGKIISEGNYSIRAKNQTGCVALMSNAVQVVKNKKPLKYQLFGGGTYCDNDPTLGLLLESSQKNVNYELFRDAISTGNIKEGTGLPLSFTEISENGLFTVNAVNSISGCSENMSGVIPFIINRSPQITISGNDEICFGDSTNLSASGGLTYIWNTIPPTNNSQIEIAPEISTTYTVIASNNTNCKSTDSIRVTVNERPEIYLENDLLSYSIICNPSGYANYDFYFADELIQLGASNVLNYSNLSLTNDTITVVVSNSASCTDIASIYLETTDIPNAFSPDGDGKNEIFLKGFDIKVFSRWGKEIYSGTDGWDGYFKGKIVTPGTYYYVLYIHDNQGNIVNTKKGSVTVVIN